MESPTTFQAWHDDFGPTVTDRWLDQFAHPNERTYNMIMIDQLVANAGLEIVEMFRVGRHRQELLPPEWDESYRKLGDFEKARVMELLEVPGGSPYFAAKKKAH